MDLRIFVEPQQGATYDTIAAVAQTAEASGFSGFFRSDHYLKMGSVDGLPGPTHAWVTLAGLARDTTSIRLGTLVSPVTFYRPGPLAIMVAQVDQMSGGRVEFGVGAGWFEDEHTTHALAFSPLGERMDMLEEYLTQITGLWSTPVGDTYDHSGRFNQFVGSPALPKPTQNRIPIILGGKGKRRTPALVAAFGSEYNVSFGSRDEVRELYDNVRGACEKIDRDPEELTYSAALVACGGATEAEFEARAEAIGREPDELRANGIAGTTEEIITKIGEFGDLGVQRIYLQMLDLGDLEQIQFFGGEILPAVR